MIPVSDEVLFARFKANPPASPGLIAQSQARLSFTLPLDYVQFLHRMNGGEGFLGEHAYVALWRVEELRERNAGYEVAEFAPGLFLFGSNGGGRGVCVRYSLRSISNCCRPLYRDGQLGRRGRYSDKLQSLLRRTLYDRNTVSAEDDPPRQEMIEPKGLWRQPQLQIRPCHMAPTTLGTLERRSLERQRLLIRIINQSIQEIETHEVCAGPGLARGRFYCTCARAGPVGGAPHLRPMQPSAPYGPAKRP
jgi:hypothetical protein